MYAVVNIAGYQVKVDKGLRLRVPRLQVEEGSTQECTDVLLVSSEGETKAQGQGLKDWHRVLLKDAGVSFALGRGTVPI